MRSARHGHLRSVSRAGLSLALLLVVAGCKTPDSTKQDPPAASAASSQAAATTTTTTAAGNAAAASATASSTPTNAVGASAGKCKRLKPGTHDPMCNIAKEVCCENAASAQERCVPRAEVKGNRCSDDGAWLVAMNCTTSSMCGPAQKCCVQEPTAGFLQTVCAPTCQHEEVCVPNLPGGGCKDPAAFDCVASDASRTGGHCVASQGGSKLVQCAAGQVRIVAAGKPGGQCADECGSICSGGVDPVQATLLNDDGTPGGKTNVRPQAAAPKLAQCGQGFARVVAPGKPGGQCRETCGSVCGDGANPVEATVLKDDGTPGGKVDVHP